MLFLQNPVVWASRGSFGRASRREDKLIRQIQRMEDELRAKEQEQDQVVARAELLQTKIAEQQQQLQQQGKQLQQLQQTYAEQQMYWPANERLNQPSKVELQQDIQNLRNKVQMLKQEQQQNSDIIEWYQELTLEVVKARSQHTHIWQYISNILDIIADPAFGECESA